MPVARQDLTGADRAWAARYAEGDVLLYSRSSREIGIGKGAYARVAAVDERGNRLTVELEDGRRASYDPRRQQGVSVYREEQRVFSRGDQVQLTAPSRMLGLANRELGTVERIEQGRLTIKFDDGRKTEIDPARHPHPHLDHGYAVTSHSAQGQTADRVLIHVDTALGAKDLLNNRMAYVAVARGALDAQIFTDNHAGLAQALRRSVSKVKRARAGDRARTYSSARTGSGAGAQARARVALGIGPVGRRVDSRPDNISANARNFYWTARAYHFSIRNEANTLPNSVTNYG